MPSLADIVLTAPNKDALVADCVKFTEERIASRSGLKGIAVKTGFSMLKAARPDFLPRAMQSLVPDFVEALEPLYGDYAKAPSRTGFAGYLEKNSDRAVQALLGVTDARAQRARNAAVKSVYAKLRSGAESEVSSALPQFAKVLNSYLPR